MLARAEFIAPCLKTHRKMLRELRADPLLGPSHRHLLLIRAVIFTGLIGARGVEPSSRVVAQVHCSKCLVIVSGMNLVRMAYTCRSPLLRC